MAKALLINPSYFHTYTSNEGGIAFPVYPVLSLASMAGAIRQRGHDVRIVDLSYRPYDPAGIRELVRRERPAVVGITATTPLVNQMRDLSFLLKEVSPETLVIGGGSHPSALPYETMLESGLDAVAAGEHDDTVARLLDGELLEQIPGLHWRRGLDEEVQINQPSRLLDELDALPMPAWDQYPEECHRYVTRLIARYRPVATVEFSRGCYYLCDFCASKRTMGLGYRKKSPERCAEELAWLERSGYREAVLVDDIFTSDQTWAMAVCESIVRRGTRIAWTCTNGIRVDSASRELFALMRRAGCYRVYFGFESGSDDVLKRFGKGGTASLTKGIEAVDLAQQAGLEPCGFFQVGLSGDTEESMQDTIEYARRLPLDAMKCGITVPFPGTGMFSQLHAEGRIRSYDWDRYNVYQNMEAVFEHPHVSWPTIRRYLKRFYWRVWFGSPRYIWRRLRYAWRNGELWWNVYYAARFWFLLWGTPTRAGTARYAYRHTWATRELRPKEIRDYRVPRAAPASRWAAAAPRVQSSPAKPVGRRTSESLLNRPRWG